VKFSWRGLKAGNFASGEIDALTKDEAVYLLKQQSIVVTELREDVTSSEQATLDRGLPAPKLKSPKVSDQELLLFTRKLTAMLASGLSVVPALEMLRDQSEKPGIKSVLAKVVIDVNGGVPISKSLEQFPRTFDSVYINLVRAGESSGSLEKFLEKIAQNIDKKIKIVSSLKSAMTYPAILLTVALGVILVMLTYVVPVFAEMYGNMGKKLPGPTQLVMTISDGIRTLWFWASVGMIICLTLYLKYKIKSSRELTLQFDKMILRLPVFGGLIQNSTVARIATIVANLISAGVSLIEAVEISRLSITNSYIQEGLENIKREVYAGNTLERILEKDARFPQTFKAFVSVGEKTGKLNDMMSSIAKYYEEEFDDSVKKMSALLEPVMIVFLGITIGFILVAMYLPIFSMGEGLS